MADAAFLGNSGLGGNLGEFWRVLTSVIESEPARASFVESVGCVSSLGALIAVILDVFVGGDRAYETLVVKLESLQQSTFFPVLPD